MFYSICILTIYRTKRNSNKNNIFSVSVFQIDLVINSDDGTVSSLDLINCAADLEKKMACSYTEKLLERLVHDKWMDEVTGSILFCCTMH